MGTDDHATPLRKSALAAHIVSSVGWIGAVASYMAPDIAAATDSDVEALRAAYLGMWLIARHVVIGPLALASLLTGLIMSLGTKWGLFLTTGLRCPALPPPRPLSRSRVPGGVTAKAAVLSR